MDNEYDPYGGHTKEEADAAYEDLFRELHGEGEFGDAKPPSSVYILTPNKLTIDTVSASICFSYLMNTVNPKNKYIPCISTPMSLEISYVLAYFEKSIKKPFHLEKLSNDNFNSDAKIILLGHNKPQLSIEKFNKNQVIEIIDCHALEGFETNQTVKVKILPFGAVSTMISHMFREYDVIANPYFAGLLCAGIITETNYFKSDNTIQADRLEAVLLANSAGIDIQDLYSKIGRTD